MSKPEANDKKMGLWGAVALAVGTMIGASIFSILGLGAQIAGRLLPEVFVVSGLLAFSVAYSYAKLGSSIVSNAGPIEFIIRGIGDGVVTGALSILNWLTYVVSISLFAKGFAGYFLSLVHMGQTYWNLAVVEIVVVVVFTALNFMGSKAIGKAEFYIVIIKLLVLGVFIALGIWTVRGDLLAPSFDAGHLKGMLYGAAIFFLSYMGFGLVTNASENIVDPKRNVPRAIYISIFVVAVVYILVAVVAVGNLPLDELIKAKDYALAEAARPFLGSVGFTLIGIGALFSISSALNATLYGGANISYALAKEGELPEIFERKVWFGAPEGLYLTAGLGLLFALLFNLDGIASITSAVFIVIYLFVIVSHYRLVDLVGGSKFLIILAFLAVFAIFVVLLIYQWNTQRDAFYTIWVVFGGSLVVEMLYRHITGRKPNMRNPAGHPGQKSLTVQK